MKATGVTGRCITGPVEEYERQFLDGERTVLGPQGLLKIPLPGMPRLYDGFSALLGAGLYTTREAARLQERL